MIHPNSFQNMERIEAGFCDAQESLIQTNLILMNQVHGADVLILTEAPPDMPSCDALVTKIPHLKLTVKTADCAPVLFVDPVAQIIGAAHAGWKGAFQGIMENTLLTMLSMGATLKNIHVAIGPHLMQQSFQIGPDMKHLFPKTEQHFFKQIDTGVYFDFTNYLVHRLKRTGLTNIEVIALDTYSDQRYNSYRRDPNNPARQYSIIMIK